MALADTHSGTQAVLDFMATVLLQAHGKMFIIKLRIQCSISGTHTEEGQK